MKQAILVASFGTTHLDTLEKTIAQVENTVRTAFPQAKLFRAFTSPTVRRRLLSDKGIRVDSVEEAMDRIAGEGYTQLTVQPTHVIPGEEYDKLCAAVRAHGAGMQVKLGRPLLYEEADMDRLVSILRQAFAPEPDPMLLLMGHGTPHRANDFYVQLAEKFRRIPGATVRLTTVEGVPTFRDLLDEVKELPVKKVVAAPLMLVAGDHAKNDMAGPEPDSLRSLLEQAGFQVECRLQGLGEIEAVRQVYVERISQAEPI